MSLLTAFNEVNEPLYAQKEVKEEELQVAEVPKAEGKGTPLEQFWGEEGPMTKEEVLNYFRDLAESSDPYSGRVPVPKQIIDENPGKQMNMSPMEWEIFDCKQTQAKRLADEKDPQRRAKLHRRHKQDLKAIKRKQKN